MQMRKSASLSHHGYIALLRSSMLHGNVLGHLVRTEQSHCTGRLCCGWYTVVAARAEIKPSEPYKNNDLRWCIPDSNFMDLV